MAPEEKAVGKPVQGQAPAERTSARPAFSPPVDIYEKEDGLTILVDMPGVEQKDLRVDIEGGVLTIDAHVEPAAETGMEQILGEYEVGDYYRAFTLPQDVDASRIQASLKDGLLTLVLPNVPEAIPRRVEVKSDA